jgi:hypothetical protein
MVSDPFTSEARSATRILLLSEMLEGNITEFGASWRYGVGN